MRNACNGPLFFQVVLAIAVVCVSYGVGYVSANSSPPPPYAYSSSPTPVTTPPHPYYSTSPNFKTMAGSKAVENETYCVAKDGADEKMLLDALNWVCGVARVDCSALQEGQACYEPNTVAAHASYAFNAYYQLNRKLTGACDFNETGTITTSNPSHGACKLPYRSAKEKSPASGLHFGCFEAVICVCLTLLILF